LGTGKNQLPRLSGLDLNLLVALDALLQEVNVTAAGRRVGLSQPAMSHSLARLRELVSDPLLVREGRTLRRSALGDRLAPAVERLLAEVETTLLGARVFAPRRATRTFRIATNDYCGAVILPGLIERIRRAAPRVHLEIHAHRGPAPVRELARGELDLGLGTFLEVDGALKRQRLFDDGFACLLRAGHPHGRGKLTLARYVEMEHLLITAPGYGLGVVDRELERRGLRRRVAVEIPFFLVAPAIVARTNLVVTLPSLLARLATTQRLRRVSAPLELARFSVEQVWHQAADGDAASVWLRDQVGQAVRSIRRANA
jgi:LysR family transcriptional regulator, transcriptional activator of nodD3 and syrA